MRGWYGALLAFWTASALAQGLSPRADSQREGGEEDEGAIHIDYDDEPTEAEKKGGDGFSYAPPIEQIFQNPAIANGLSSGADAINRSVESLMDALFYRLLDTEKNLALSDDSWFHTALKRDLYSTPTGSYVVVERFQLGPRFGKELWRAHDIPVTLGVDGTVEVLQIYLRTDGMRLAEQEDLSPLRRWINNWFGILPALAAVLPPSFNQNELYDPIKQLETPFSFPLDLEGFRGMPVGSIRSYAISGGIRTAIDFGGMLDRSSKDLLERVGGLAQTVPYGIFKRGEHRINVLRHSPHSAWVGVNELNRTGHSLSPLLSQKYFILRGALAARIFDWQWIWSGVPMMMMPIDLNFEQAVADLFDQVYEYDLRKKPAQEAYFAAVRGDFLPSRLRYLDAKERHIDTGVSFHFARNQDRTEVQTRNGPNFTVYRNERRREHSEAEIEITDQEGKFYVLEAAQDVADKGWDVLVGEEEGRVQQTVEMRVKRVVDKDRPNDPKAYSYAFEVGEDSYRLNASLSIQDRYLDATEYQAYIDQLRYFTGLPLSEVPRLEVRDREALRERRQGQYFTEPHAAVTELHVTPTYLGRFGAQAVLSFSPEELDRIASRPEDDLWAAFARVYGLNEREWREAKYRRSYAHQARWVSAFVFYPTRLFNLRLPSVDAIKEATNAVEWLLKLRDATTPESKLEAFHRLLDTDHPRQLARALLELSDRGSVPRRVTFSAQPKGVARHEVKTSFGKLNNMVVKSGPPFPGVGRYSRAKNKLGNFYLDQPREAGKRPSIAKIDVSSRAVPASLGAINIRAGGAASPRASDRRHRHVFLAIEVKDLAQPGAIKLYVRIEQAGRIKIGKLELAEKVIELLPVRMSQSAAGTLTYRFYVTGPLSPLSNYVLDQAVAQGDEFLVTLAASREGAVWSEERMLEFRFERGRLMPPR